MKKLLNEQFNIETTGIPTYDYLLENGCGNDKYPDWDYVIEEMEPIEYIGRCAQGFNCDIEALINNRLDDSISKYYAEMEDGTKFDLCYLNESSRDFHYNYHGKGYWAQEGLHRAIVAMMLNEQTIPVMIIKDSANAQEMIECIVDETIEE